MTLVLEQINVEGITQLSYLVGNDNAVVATAIDLYDLYLLLVVDIYLLQLTWLYVPLFLPGLAADNRSRKINTKGDRALVK
ncbi:hypothetical protein C7B62_21680 [Pleurocapsa sp. CCALA 161]|uniref:hypothetical protein n=1 Tax=Pleurocapsa sp. CCALA 161 TaxID=2107688 RepID=UPI000D070E90|nr:hypothetical protein [Pleurocapsa sp. CCALA 161]PSB06842.1 hypothetical protein C7B62_21680 [Pleurocapsa sp. CCALA 161]